MKYFKYYLLLFFVGIHIYGQEPAEKYDHIFIVPEFLLGKTMEANTGFPKSKLQKSFFVSLGSYNNTIDKQWTIGLSAPKTGVSFGITDFGNSEKIGMAYVLMPYIETGLFRKKSSRWNLNVGIGAAYIDTQFDPELNPLNQAVTTRFNWFFRSFFYYDLLKRQSVNWRLGLGYTHYSNGHTRLPNQGLNSFLFSLSSSIGREPDNFEEQIKKKRQDKNRYSQLYFSLRTGIGQNVLSRVFNDKREVYSVAASSGKIINRNFKFGAGFYYRFYEHYYNYINENLELVQDQYSFFRENPYRYATNFGFFTTAELFIGHVGIEFDIGINIYKPFYKVDWQLSQGYFYNNEYVRLGELNSYYKVKQTVSSRLGVKYYLFNSYKLYKNNLFLGVHINSNLGQADFSELSLGYVYRFNLKKHKKEEL
ncbi:acyloxyacyl hydrolase [Aquimarina sediminis]|uniref:acyloxyacyl hydrolase n=1 Tax=Aquimarina sediminis TaxID=2070536 RepID=UPI000CA00775|nr:acyloxyacyl hydrolase [Aquimarina sediminis]